MNTDHEAPEFVIRPATPFDAYALAVVHCDSIQATFSGLLDDYVAERSSVQYCEQGWETRLANAEVMTVVLLSGKQIVGFASVGPSPDGDVKGVAGELDRIYLHPSVWGSGHGGTLLKWCEEKLIELNFRTIKLWVFEVNERAIRFYEKQGYKPDGCKKRAFNATLLRYGKYV